MTCPHNKKLAVWTTLCSDIATPLERRQLRPQCCDCGKLLSAQLSHSLATAHTPALDEERARVALENEQEARDRAWAARRQEWQRERDEESEQWWDQYSAYLQTDEWRHRRTLVMGRAGGVCEGCQERRATQVHHLSYQHVTNEFLWELVAICDVCHRRIHDFPLDGVPRASSV